MTNPLFLGTESRDRGSVLPCMRWLALTSVLVAGCGSVPPKKTADTESPEVARVMRKYEEALGGRERVMGIKTREIIGTFEYEGVGQHGTGSLEMRWRAPDSLVEQLRGPMGTVTRGFDGKRAWGTHPQAGVRQLSPFEIDEMILDGVLYQPLGVRHWYEQPSYEGRTNVGGRDTEVLAAKRRGGREDRFYFDVTTGLPARLDVWEEGPEAVRSGNAGEFYLAHYQLDDYRMVDGVAVPFLVRRQRPNSTMTFRFTEVRHDVTMSDSLFESPGQTGAGS